MKTFWAGSAGALVFLLGNAAAAQTQSAAQTAATAPRFLAAHQAALALDGGATAWILTSTALVLLMTLPGLALFYGGMVRRKNVLATLAQSAAVAAVVSLLWFALGYSLSFGQAPGAAQSVIGSLDAALLNGVRIDTAHRLAPALPEYLWVAYQMTFAIITPALIAGAFAERMKFSALLLFTALWSLVVYAPTAHWVWGGGFLGELGVLDFAGGGVVHVNSGVAGLVCALFLGARRGHRREPMPPHNLILTMIGGSLLLVGWLGFNAGSAWAADAIAAVAALNTMLAAAAGAVAWMLVEWVERKKPTLLGLVTGSVAGLVGVTPAAGLVDPKGAVLIGLATGPACYAACVWIKNRFGYDDSLDAFGVHGAGGIVGALLTGVFATEAINAAGAEASVLKQAIGVLAVMAWSAIATLAILLVCRFTVGLRVAPEHEVDGLDVALHGEALH